jgi:hypothetical protein
MQTQWSSARVSTKTGQYDTMMQRKFVNKHHANNSLETRRLVKFGFEVGENSNEIRKNAREKEMLPENWTSLRAR